MLEKTVNCSPIGQVFNEKTVLVTGHTGFKGSWLSLWLSRLGANVVGIAKDPPTSPSLYDVVKDSAFASDHRLDICDVEGLRDCVQDVGPDFVFHLAAEAVVSTSYKTPIETYNTNALGTVNLLESLRSLDRPCSAVLITSDKVYRNVEWVWGYRESDVLGGSDPYSGSKAAAEILIQSHLQSFFPISGNVRVAVARAGNVIGGGDWAENRVVPDFIRSVQENQSLKVRKPKATRPWQHVLEPLSGYITLARVLAVESILHKEAFNFGPNQTGQARTVQDLIENLASFWTDCKSVIYGGSKASFAEAGLLQLNCDKVESMLGWRAILDFEETTRLTAEWYLSYLKDPADALGTTNAQIDLYIDYAKMRRAWWAH